jgi:hypothetical protein
VQVEENLRGSQTCQQGGLQIYRSR